MANNFFSKFPTVDYNMDGRGSLLTLTNIVRNVDVNDLYANNSTYYTYHTIQDGERPDIVSYRIYGNPNYYWTFFILNNELRSGLNFAWPLSSNQLERMLESEYDPYSAITFLPVKGAINGLANSGVIHLTYFWEAYLPYLRIVSSNKTEWARILRYDNDRMQLLVHTIERVDGSGPPITIDNFLSSNYFMLNWSNPFNEVDDATNWAECERLKVEFIDRMVEIYYEFDSTAKPDVSLYDELGSQAAIDAAIMDYKSDYVFNKQYWPAPRAFIWESYRNAASEYYVETEMGNTSVSVYDTLMNDNVIIPKYISYYEKESILNSRKVKIRVIRPDRIADFVNSYFSVLNGQ